MHKMSVVSQCSDTTAFQLSESEEDILPVEVVLAMGSEKRTRGSRDSRILKTTEIEICGDQEDEKGAEKEKVVVGEGGKWKMRASQRGW